MVGIVPSILGFVNLVTPYTQQLGCDSSTIRNHPSSTLPYTRLRAILLAVLSSLLLNPVRKPARVMPLPAYGRSRVNWVSP
jgi:hypothetical protein